MGARLSFDDAVDLPLDHRIGANAPPVETLVERRPPLDVIAQAVIEQTPDTFGALQAHILDLFETAKDFLDGEPITTQGQADAVSKIVTDLRAADKLMDAARIAEKAPLDALVQAVQDKYNPFIQPKKGKVDLALAACKAALAPWLIQVQAELDKVAAEKRKEADALIAKAAEAAQAARATDLASQEAAELLVRAAKKANTVANKAESTTARGEGGGKAITLRTSYAATLTDRVAACEYYADRQPEALDAFLTRLADADAREASGKVVIPGFNIVEVKAAA